MQTQKSTVFFLSLFLLSVFTVAILITNFACTPPKPEIDPARQQAIDDSLKKVAEEKYKFELRKNWSFGFENYKAKMYQSALKYFWIVAEIDTIQMFKPVWSKIVDSYFKLEKPDSAQIACEMGLEKYPDYLYLHRSLAHLLTGLNKVDEAISHYETIVNMEPKAVDDWKKLANLQLKNDQIDDAITSFEMVTELNPNDQEANDILSKLYAQTGNEEGALERLKKVREQDPDNPKHMFNLGRTYFMRQNYAAAAPEFRAYLKLIPDDNVAREFLGSSLQNQEKYQEAINVYNTILEKNPKHKKAMCELATCLKFLKRFREARSYANRALQIDASYGLALVVRGEIYEATVDNCMARANRSSPNWDDKLVYELAYNEYKKAKEDPQFSDLASRKMSYVRQVMPTQEDRFMHKGETRAKAACYSWIY